MSIWCKLNFGHKPLNPNYFKVLRSFCSATNVDDKKLLFFDARVQELLKKLTRKDLNKVFKPRKLGDKLKTPVYKFMTKQELQEALNEADTKADSLLKMPPVVPAHKETSQVFSQDPKLVGYSKSKFVFTDITYGKTDRNRLVAVRDPDGTLRRATYDEKRRMNEIYFPRTGRELWMPVMFQQENLRPIVERKDYEFILERACVQFEPDDPEFIRVNEYVYNAINDCVDFELLRSTRHFGPLVFYLAINSKLDNLILENVQVDRLEDAAWALNLHNIVHPENKIDFNYQIGSELEFVKAYIDQVSKTRKTDLELNYKKYKDLLASPKSEAVA